MKDKKVIGIIPARMGSTRFPNKAVYEIEGKPLFMWPVKAAQKAKLLYDVYIATDSDEIAELAEKHGVKCFRNTISCKCGTERLAEFAYHNPNEYYLNIQADEALIESWMIDLLIERALKTDSEMATIITPVVHEEELEDKNTVKVVCDQNNKALYFSRSAIPYANHMHSQYRKHIGVYFYKESILKLYGSQPISNLEYAESLEQLRALEYGVNIHCVDIEEAAEIISVNTRSDIVKLTEILNNRL